MMKKLLILFASMLCFLLFFSGVFKNGNSLLTELARSSTPTVSEDTTTKTIVIDAGHGGYDSGSIAKNGTYEKDITMAIALKTGALLEAKGYDIVYTRTNDEVSWSNDNVDDLQSRVEIAEAAKANYYLSIHLNASALDDGASGFELYHNYKNTTIASIASSLENALNALQYTQDRGIKSTEDSPLYVIDNNSVPSLLVELGFITDSTDEAYLSSETGQNFLAKAMADSIDENVRAS